VHEKGNDQEGLVKQRERKMVAWFASNLHRSVADIEHGSSSLEGDGFSPFRRNPWSD
jgi:hypothetical protein